MHFTGSRARLVESTARWLQKRSVELNYLGHHIIHNQRFVIKIYPNITLHNLMLRRGGIPGACPQPGNSGILGLSGIDVG